MACDQNLDILEALRRISLFQICLYYSQYQFQKRHSELEHPVEHHLYFMRFFFILQSHSIHGMTEEEAGIRPYKEMGILTYEEKKFLLAVERGDVASTRR